MNELLAGITGIAPVLGLDNVWTWSIGRFRRLAFLDARGSTVFRMNTAGDIGSGLMEAVVRHTRTRWPADLLSPVTIVPEFVCDGYGFDVLAIPRREVFVHDKNEFPELARVAIAIFPAFTCEFSGQESVEEATYRVSRALLIARMDRTPVPYLKIKYRNPAFGGLTKGKERYFMPYDALTREIRQLENVRDAYVEFETYTGRVWRVSWDGGFILGAGDEDVQMALEQLLEFTYEATFGQRELR
jgi:hypothetical protein